LASRSRCGEAAAVCPKPSGLRPYRAGYVNEGAEGPEDMAPFWRDFAAEDLGHAREQALDASQEGERLIALFHREYVMEASELTALVAAVAGAEFVGRLLERARFLCSEQARVSHEGARVGGSEVSRRVLDEVTREGELLGDAIASLRALAATEGVHR
jgi:hypothetical protein